MREYKEKEGVNMAKIKMNFALEENLKAWIEEQSEIYGVSQTGFISMALTQFKQQQEALNTMKDMGALMQKMTDIEKELKKVGK